MRGPQKWWTEEDDKFLKSCSGRMTIQECADLMGRSRPSVSTRLLVLKKRGVNISFMRHTHSDEDVELCRQLSDSGMSALEISRKMELYHSTVYNWVIYKYR